jgi:hypothetical protein
MRAPRAIVLVLLAGVAVAIAGCGDESESEAGSEYGAQVEELVAEAVAPQTVAASDALVNVMQGGSVAEATRDLERASRALREARERLRGLDPAESAAQPAGDLGQLVGALAAYLAEPHPDLGRAAGARVNAVKAYRDGIEALAGALVALAEEPGS